MSRLPKLYYYRKRSRLGSTKGFEGSLLAAGQRRDDRCLATLRSQVQTLTTEFQERMKMVEMQMVQLQQMVMPDGTANPQAVEQQQLLYTQVRLLCRCG